MSAGVQMQPKPRPTYGFLQVDELLDATLDAILGSKQKSPVTGALHQTFTKQVWATGGAEWGGTKGWWGKVGNSRAKVPRKRYVSDTEDDEDIRVGRKGGCAYGAANWQEQDITALMDLIEELLPAGKKEWVRLYAQFSKWAEENNCPMQSSETVEKQFKTVSVILSLPSSNITHFPAACLHIKANWGC